MVVAAAQQQQQPEHLKVGVCMCLCDSRHLVLAVDGLGQVGSERRDKESEFVPHRVG